MLSINYEKHKSENFEKMLLQNLPQPTIPKNVNGRVNFLNLINLPPPIERYFKHVLTDGQTFISHITNNQTGQLRTSKSSKRWHFFTATYLATPIASGFVWSANVKMLPTTWLRVLDCYISGVGIGQVDLFSFIPLVSESNQPELNSGALHRYLAEAVWYPTALLPESGVEWTPIDNYLALATLTDKNITVSLKFRFNEQDEITGIYTDSRYEKLNGKYQLATWEGHFENYITHSGMRVPTYGEVGWFKNNVWECVWKAHISNIQMALQ